MRLSAALILAGAIVADANALVIVPPTVYFLTLSLSAFLANALVSLFIFGALRGLMGKKLWGKSVFEVASSGVSALGTALVALIAMASAAYFIVPLDLPSAAVCAFAAGAIFLAFKIVLSFKEYAVSPGTRRSLAISWLSLAAFVALAAGVSSVLAVEERLVDTTTGFSQAQSGGIVQGIADDYSRAVQAPAMGAVSSAAKQKVDVIPIANEADNAFIAEPNLPSSNAVDRIWFQPASKGECFVSIGSFRKTFVPSFSCAVVANGVKAKAFCPVWADAAQTGQAGAVEFSATGSCDDKGVAFVSDGVFKQINR